VEYVFEFFLIMLHVGNSLSKSRWETGQDEIIDLFFSACTAKHSGHDC
jgi:hypothetical protein